MFHTCESLKTVVFYPNTQLTALSLEMFKNCSSLNSIDIPDTVTSLGDKAFIDCSALKGISLPKGVTSIGNQTFFGCTSLESIEIPAGVTKIGGNAFASCSSLKRVDFLNEGGDITFGSDIFKNVSSLETVIFKESCGITALGTYMLYGAGIKALSLPNSITAIGNCSFGNCSKLGPVYLPFGITTVSQESNTFSGNSKMYFVNEPFDVDAYNADNSIVKKPSIYCFPNVFEKITVELFKNCNNMNDTLVMGDKLTSVENGWAFGRKDASTTTNIVFLGNITKIGFSNESKYTSFYFCNKSTTAENLEIFYGNGNSIPQENNKVFIHLCEDGVYRNANSGKAFETDTAPHVFEKAAVTVATCTEPSMSADFCFCGAPMTEPVIFEAAFGHNHDESIEANISFVYTSLIENGTRYVKCSRCDDKISNYLPAPFGTKGMSITDDGYLQSYSVNGDALESYIMINSISSYEFGIIIGTYRQIGGNAPINANGTTYNNKTLKVNYTDTGYAMFDIKLNGLTEAYADERIILCAYVILDKTVYYISNNKSSTEPAFYSYNQVNDIVSAALPETVDFIYNTKEKIA